MKCPKCGFENKEDARFCKECGNKLSMSRDEEIYEKSKNSEELYPDKTGTYREEYDDGETMFQDDQNEYIPGPYGKKKGKGILFLAIAVFVICIAAAAGTFFFLSSHNQEKQAANEITASDTAAETTTAPAGTADTSTGSDTQTTADNTSPAADTRAIGNTVAIGSENEEETDQVLEDTGADSYDYADITSAEDFNGIYLDSDYSIVYPKNFFKGANVIDGGYEFYTADNQVTLTVTKKELEGDSEKTLKKIHNQYEKMLGTDKENNGVNISPGDHVSDGWRHTIVAGNEEANPGKGIYMIAAADDKNVYMQVFEYVDVSGGQEYCPQNYVIECLYRGCSFSFTSHPKIRSYERYMEEGNDILN